MNTNQHTSAKSLNYFISVKLLILGINVSQHPCLYSFSPVQYKFLRLPCINSLPNCTPFVQIHIILGGLSVPNALTVMILLVHQLAAINVSCCVSSIYILSFRKLFLLFVFSFVVLIFFEWAHLIWSRALLCVPYHNMVKAL